MGDMEDTRVATVFSFYVLSKKDLGPKMYEVVGIDSCALGGLPPNPRIF